MTSAGKEVGVGLSASLSTKSYPPLCVKKKKPTKSQFVFAPGEIACHIRLGITMKQHKFSSLRVRAATAAAPKWREPHRARRSGDWSRPIFCVWQQQNEAVSAQLPGRPSRVPCSQWADFIVLYYRARLRVAVAVCVWLGNKPSVTVALVRRNYLLCLSFPLTRTVLGKPSRPQMDSSKNHKRK